MRPVICDARQSSAKVPRQQTSTLNTMWQSEPTMPHLGIALKTSKGANSDEGMPAHAYSILEQTLPY
jgi:hypothetical protein